MIISPLNDLLKFMSDHYVITLIGLAWLVKSYGAWRGREAMAKASIGSKVKNIQSEADWATKVSDAGDKLVVVDFFATWCGPCVRAAPVFATLSQEMDENKVEFWKVDVDQLSSISKKQAISCMPTFKFYRAGKGNLTLLETVQGWNESKVRALVKEHAT